VRTRSELWRRALELIPGGVNSPVRAMRAVGLDEPLFVRRASGSRPITVSTQFTAARRAPPPMRS